MVLKPGSFPKVYFVPGRMAMTCCADDMAFLGFACAYEGAEDLEEKQWVRVTALVRKEYFADYGGEGPILEALNVENTEAPDDRVVFVNVRVVIAWVIGIAGFLILLFVVKAVIDNYQFAQRRKVRNRHKKRRKFPSEFDDYDF